MKNRKEVGAHARVCMHKGETRDMESGCTLTLREESYMTIK